MKIIYLKNAKINKLKWNSCIDNAHNGLIYAYSDYLDIIAKNWDALITEDYTAVMPLIWNKKYGIRYIYQPFFLQQTGVFSIKKLSENKIYNFIKQIPTKFRHVNINLNYANKPENFNFTTRTNYELYLYEDYKELYKKFNQNTRRNIKKAEKNKLILIKNIKTKEFIKFNKENNFINISDDIFRRLGEIINYCKLQNRHKIYVIKNENNEFISAVFFMYSHNRAYYISSITNKEGKEKRANFYIINEFIKEYAGRNIILDFEGSNIVGIARFFAGWGAKQILYFNYIRNNLPEFIKKIKKL